MFLTAYHSSLKIHWSHKLGSFYTEILQDLHRYSNVLTVSKSDFWGLQSIYWAFLRVTHFENAVQESSTISMKNKVKYMWSLATYICEKLKKKLLWSMHWRLHYHRMLSGKSKSYAISLLCNITQIWHLLSVSTRNIIHLAVIWVGLYKKKLLWSNTEDYTVTRNGVLLKWL